jgi:hypothetical protein
MKKQVFIGAAALLALGASGAALAQDGDDIALDVPADAMPSYAESIRCGTVLTMVAGMIEDDDAATASSMEEAGMQFSVLAALTEGDTESVDEDADRIANEIVAFSENDDPAAFVERMQGETVACRAIKDAHTPAFVAVEALLAQFEDEE